MADLRVVRAPYSTVTDFARLRGLERLPLPLVA